METPLNTTMSGNNYQSEAFEAWKDTGGLTQKECEKRWKLEMEKHRKNIATTAKEQRKKMETELKEEKTKLQNLQSSLGKEEPESLKGIEEESLQRQLNECKTAVAHFQSLQHEMKIDIDKKIMIIHKNCENLEIDVNPKYVTASTYTKKRSEDLDNESGILRSRFDRRKDFMEKLIEDINTLVKEYNNDHKNKDVGLDLGLEPLVEIQEKDYTSTVQSFAKLNQRRFEYEKILRECRRYGQRKQIEGCRSEYRKCKKLAKEVDEGEFKSTLTKLSGSKKREDAAKLKEMRTKQQKASQSNIKKLLITWLNLLNDWEEKYSGESFIYKTNTPNDGYDKFQLHGLIEVIKAEEKERTRRPRRTRPPFTPSTSGGSFGSSTPRNLVPGTPSGTPTRRSTTRGSTTRRDGDSRSPSARTRSDTLERARNLTLGLSRQDLYPEGEK